MSGRGLCYDGKIKVRLPDVAAVEYAGGKAFDIVHKNGVTDSFKAKDWIDAKEWVDMLMSLLRQDRATIDADKRHKEEEGWGNKRSV